MISVFNHNSKPHSKLKYSKIPEETDCQVDLEGGPNAVYPKYFFSDSEYENLKYKHLDNKLYRKFMKMFFKKAKHEMIENDSQLILPYSLGYIECGKSYRGAILKGSFVGWGSLKARMGYIMKFRVVVDKNFVIYYVPFFNTSKNKHKPTYKFGDRVYFSSYLFKSSHETRNEFIEAGKYKDFRTLRNISDIETTNKFKLAKEKERKNNKKPSAEEILGRRSTKAEWLQSIFNDYERGKKFSY